MVLSKRTGSMRVVSLGLMLTLVYLVVTEAKERPPYIQCVDSSECGFGHCCVIGQGRFSIPQCMEYGEAGKYCRPRDGYPNTNMTVRYPDGSEVHLTDVYSIMCPCAPGLYCSEETSTCEDMLSFQNTIDGNPTY